jgi:hypothetical protein
MISVKNPLLICFTILISFFYYPTTAQNSPKRGDPNLKPYKEQLKQAKNGNLKAALLIAKVCKGHPLESGLYKDYQKAVEWYQKALVNPADSLAEAAKGLFSIYMTGGYGVQKDINQARKYHQIFANKAITTSYFLQYNDKKDIDLRDFFLVFDSVKVHQKLNDKLKLARLYWEFGINPDAALDSISYLVSLMPDALYLHEKWQLEAKYFAETQQMFIPDKVLYNLIEKHILMGSNLARSEWAGKAMTSNEGNRFYLKPDEMQRLIATYTDSDIEMQFKMNFILQKYQQGVPHYETLRKLHQIAPKTDSVTRYLGKTALDEFVQFDSSITNIPDLVEEMRENSAIKLFELDINVYQNNFNGYIKPLLKLYADIQKPEVLKLVGEKNLSNYMAELNKKIRPVFDQIDQVKKVIEFKKAYDTDVWLSYFKADFDTLVSCRLKDFEINDTNISYYYEMLIADNIKFKSLAEGKQYLYNLQGKILDPMYRAKIAGYLKEKIIQDVVGNEPTKEQIENLQRTVDNESWLQPEGKNKWFQYTSDSKNWFSGKVQKKNIVYAYTVIRQTSGEKSDFTIRAISDEKSSLAYSGQLKISETKKGEYTITICFSKYVNYGWVFFDNDYLKVTYKYHEPLITALPYGGNMAAAIDKSHGLPANMVLQKVAPADFSEKTAIRTALTYLIWECSRAFNK